MNDLDEAFSVTLGHTYIVEIMTQLYLEHLSVDSPDISIGITCRPTFPPHTTRLAWQLLVPLIVEGNRSRRGEGEFFFEFRPYICLVFVADVVVISSFDFSSIRFLTGTIDEFIINIYWFPISFLRQMEKCLLSTSQRYLTSDLIPFVLICFDSLW